MKKNVEMSFAESMETEKSMIPFLPELLSDMWALGSSPQLIVDLLRPLGLVAGESHLLDLGCGKGAVAVIVARELGINVTGIDAFKPFLKAAEEKAKEYHVSALCQFERADIFEFIKIPRDYDIIVFASLGGLLGTFDLCVGHLRNLIQSGGYIIIDDGYLKGFSPLKRKGYMHYFPYDKTVAQLTSHGDTLVMEVSTDDETKQINQEYLSALKNKRQIFITKHPEMEKDLDKYIETQETECRVLDKYISGVIWVIQKTK
jgi:2-polyprenyl-3-methyl-5-hydroxy-6-metoxy-1,4-benzoquinol methylase